MKAPERVLLRLTSKDPEHWGNKMFISYFLFYHKHFEILVATPLSGELLFKIDLPLLVAFPSTINVKKKPLDNLAFPLW